MQVKIAQALGLNTDQEAALTLSIAQDEIHFLAVLKIECDDAFTRGRQLLSQLSEEFFESEGSIGQRLQSVFTKNSESLVDIEKFDILLATISGKALYLISKGEVSAYLKRSFNISSVLTNKQEQLVSGFLNEGDRVFLTTRSLSEYLESEDSFGKSLELPLDIWEDTITTALGMEGLEKKGFAGLLIDIEPEEEVTIPPTQKEEVEYLDPDQVKSSPVKFSLPSIFKKVPKFFPKSGRGRLILGLTLLLIIGAGLGYQFVSHKHKLQDARFVSLLQAANDDYKAALSLQSLNTVEAKSKLDSAKDNLNKALTIKPNDSQAKALKEQIARDEGGILQTNKDTIFTLFLDLNLMREGFQSDNLELSSGKILLLEKNTKSLALLDIAQKSHQILAGKTNLGEALFASLNGGIAFVYSKDKGVLRVDSSNQKVSLVTKVDEGWGNIVDLYGFAGNVYLLDTISNQIWKYLPTTDGYSGKREYLEKQVKVDFAGAREMEIESSVYVLKQAGEILRFTKGTSDFFSIGGLDKGIKDPKSIFTSSEVENLYILDSGNGRLVVVDKKGAYRAQYQGDKFSSASDLVVDEKGKKVYLLDGNKIYTMDLK